MRVRVPLRAQNKPLNSLSLRGLTFLEYKQGINWQRYPCFWGVNLAPLSAIITKSVIVEVGSGRRSVGGGVLIGGTRCVAVVF